MRSVWRLATVSAFLIGLATYGSAIDAYAQPSQTAPPAQENAELTLTAETFCSETRLRTSNARFRWNITRTALAAARVDNLAASKQSLETTVYKGGFEKGLSAALPIGAVTPDRPVAAVAAQPRQAQVRAFQLRLIEVDLTRAQAVTDTGSEMSAVVENLEPGVSYTWRVAIDTAAGRLVSPSIKFNAPVCPADMAETPNVPRRKP